MNRYEAQRGQTLIMAAVALFVLIGATGLAVDVGYHQYQQRLQQTAADSAALAGAKELIAEPFNQAKAAARADAATDGYTDGVNNVTVTVNNPPASPSVFNADSNAVEVIVTAVHPTFFEAIFNQSVTVSTRAVATLQPAPDNGCVYLLSSTTGSNFNNPNGGVPVSINGPNCSININNTANFNNATVNAQSVGCVVTCSNTSGVSPAATTITPVTDPCYGIPSCAALAKNPPSTMNCTSATYTNGSVVPPGCYNNLTLRGTVTLSPGIYVITGTIDTNQATVNGASASGSGVTIYLGASASMNFNQANLNLSACTTSCTNGAEANVLFYEVPTNTNGPNFNKSASTNLSGLLYFPSASLNLNKSLGGGAVLVASSANFNGGTYTFKGSGVSSFGVEQPVLAE